MRMHSDRYFGTRRLARGSMLALGALLGAVAPLGGSASAAPSETVLHAFTGSDGNRPEAGLIADSKGNLYGTTINGGPSGKGCDGFGCGVVFKLAPPVPPATKWKETVLYSFCGKPSCSDGEFPQVDLIADKSGNLYGTTSSGGAKCSISVFGCGVVFKLSPPAVASASWKETVLHSFTGGSDGGKPSASLYLDGSCNLYGTASQGGTSARGVVFKISTTGTSYKVLHDFIGSDGAFPDAGLIADTSGNLYGTTGGGGGAGCSTLSPPGCGVVFVLPAKGAYKVLHHFAGGSSDGANPIANLYLDGGGNLSGTTFGGGGTKFGGCGTVFKVSTTGTNYKVLHSFTCGSDGGFPFAGLIADKSGNLYGTAANFGAKDAGVVFELSRTGNYTVLYDFCSKTKCSDGAFPDAGLIADSKGNLYSTTSSGGASAAGTVFELTGTGFVP